MVPASAAKHPHVAAHRSTAWPLAWAYVALIVYASLHPFGPWRWQGVEPWRFITSPPRQVWLGFDGISNLMGYMPLGFLLCVGWLRRDPTCPARWAALGASGFGVALSLAMEATQNYLPMRVPSLLDLGLNALGAALGAALAALVLRLGWMQRWSVFRAHWFIPAARGTLALLALWPFALLYPAAVPLGLGQVLERLEENLALWWMDTPFLEWLPVRDVELQPLVPGVEMLCVLLGALVPCLLGYSIVPRGVRRAGVLVGVLAVGVGASSLSAALSYGPQHAWAWISLSTQVGLIGYVLCAALLGWVPPRGCAVLALVALMCQLMMINQAPTSAYFAQTLQGWEQGRFARFNGLGEWLGWLWPFAALLVLVLRLSARPSPRPPARRAAASNASTFSDGV